MLSSVSSKTSASKPASSAVFTGGKVAARLSPDHYDKFNMLLELIEKKEGQRPAIAILVRQMVEEGIEKWCTHYEIDEASLKRWRSRNSTSKSLTRSKK
jgi:hypothetical protein